MHKRVLFLIFIITILTFVILLPLQGVSLISRMFQSISQPAEQNEGGPDPIEHPLSIEYARRQNYPGSDLTIEQKLDDQNNYYQYIASYKSDGLKIYGLLTVPKTPQNSGKKYPVIIFNHGYIPPDQYRTTERYTDYVDGFAKRGYIVFKPDYRGHGNSEGKSTGAYYSPAYTIDVLNALAALKRYQSTDPQRIGMWGHSMGGYLTLRSMVISGDIKVGVICSGVVGTYEELITKWRRAVSFRPPNNEAVRHLLSIREHLQKTYGTPANNPVFWHAIDPRFYLKDIAGPIQLHHGLSDESVPWEFTESLKNDLEKLKKTVEYYTYPDGNHNLSSPHFETAMQRSIAFFDQYLKNE